MLVSNPKIFNIVKDAQFALIIILLLTLPYFIAPHFTFLMSILIFLTTILTYKDDIKSLFKEKTIIYLYLFILLTYISALWTPSDNIFGGNFKVSIEGYINYFFLIPSIYFSNLPKEKIKLLFIVLIMSPVIYAILYFTNYFELTHIYSYHSDSINGNNSLYADLFANIFLLTSSVFLYINFLHNIFAKHYKKAFIVLIPLTIFSTALFIDETTVSRLVNLSFAILIVLISLYMFPKKLKFAIFIPILLLSTLLLNDSYKKGINELKDVYKESRYEGSWGHRLKLAAYGIGMWTENPYFGRGTVDIIEKMRQIKQEHPEDFNDPTVHFHNNHILILVQIGVIGYAVFLLFIYNLYKLNIKDEEISLYKKATTVIFFTLMMGEHYLELMHTSTLLAILVGLFLLYKKQEVSSIH